MGAAFLARLGATVGQSRPTWISAREAMLYTACAGSSRTGPGTTPKTPKYHWVDNFHTGYNLSALHAYDGRPVIESFDDGLVRGTAFFTKHFFEADGRPRYFHNQLSRLTSSARPRPSIR